jgi:hypothetical protein
MTRCGNGGKPQAGFPPFPRTLGNREGSDFHIPTAAAAIPLARIEKNVKKHRTHLGAMEKWKSKSRISTFPPPRQPAAARPNNIPKK